MRRCAICFKTGLASEGLISYTVMSATLLKSQMGKLDGAQHPLTCWLGADRLTEGGTLAGLWQVGQEADLPVTVE
jgi:hypothetical protein